MFDNFDNPFAMVVAIVAIVVGARVWRTHMITKAKSGNRSAEDDKLIKSMQGEIHALSERVRVLEKLVTDDDRQLASEINRLRDIGTTGANT